MAGHVCSQIGCHGAFNGIGKFENCLKGVKNTGALPMFGPGGEGEMSVPGGLWPAVVVRLMNYSPETMATLHAWDPEGHGPVLPKAAYPCLS